MAIRRVVDRILEHPAVYAAWQAPFVSQKFAPVKRHLSCAKVRRVLDVGCVPATNARRFTGAEYVGSNFNEHYLEIARSKYSGQFIQADLETADLSALGTFDTILVNSFLHHLPDDTVRRSCCRVFICSMRQARCIFSNWSCLKGVRSQP
jgi:SAM-dependent methyltransferase